MGIRLLSVVIGFASLGASNIRPTLINGVEVDPAQWKQVVKISSGNAGCTATIVGPRAILTAAHCAATGAKATFSVNGKSYSATMTQSPLYASKDHDINLGVTSEEIAGVTPLSVGGVPTVGQSVTLMGYGCTTTGGTGSDGKLRSGKSTVSAAAAMRFSSTTPNGALLCPGDSGGPAFVEENGNIKVMGVNSAVGITPSGTIIGPNHNARTDGAEHQDFIKKWAQTNSVDICGVTKQCGTGPGPAEPSCSLAANPSSIQQGGSLTLSLTASNAVSAMIEGQSVGVPNGQRTLTPVSSGTAFATVTGSSGQQAGCSTSYTVTPKDPGGAVACTLTANPKKVKVGESVTLEINATGGANYASIDGGEVSTPVGKRILNPKNKGDYSAVGFVRLTSSGASANCYAEYRVDDGGVLPPDLPVFGLTPTYCGSDSNSSSTGISRVCLGVLKKDSNMTHSGFIESISVKYLDGSEELLPVIARRPVGSSVSKDELALFANAVVAGSSGSGSALDTRLATVTKGTDGAPSLIEGKTKSGKNFRATVTAQ